MEKFRAIFFAAITLIVAVTFNSCSSDDPKVAKTDIEFRAVSSQFSLGNARVEVSEVTFTEVLIGVTEIEFETAEENESEDDGDFEDDDDDGEDDNEKVEFEGSYVVDVLNGTSTPDFGLANLSQGIFEEIEIELGPVLEGGNTVFVAFSFVPDGGGDAVNVEYSNNYKLEFEIENESGFTLENGVSSILVLFDLDAFMGGIDLSNAVADQDGIIRINATSNSDIANDIESNFSSIMRAGEDDDHDGEFDEEDDDND
jgi:hypothetical protein